MVGKLEGARHRGTWFNLTGFLRGGESLCRYVHNRQLFEKFCTTKLVRLSCRCMQIPHLVSFGSSRRFLSYPQTGDKTLLKWGIKPSQDS